MWITKDCRGKKQVWYSEREVNMKVSIALILFILGMLFFCEIGTLKKLDKLIELNTPQAINVIDENFVLEKD